MTKQFFAVFSYLFHPIFIPLFGTLLYLYFGDNYVAKQYYYLLLMQVVIITIFLPLAFFYLLKTFGKIDTIMISNANQRKIPLLLQIGLTTVLITRGIKQDLLPELYWFFFAGIASAILAFLFIYLKIKASLHMLGIGALTFFLIALSQATQTNFITTIASLFLITGFVATSRLFMKAHTINELAIGYIIGIVPQLFVAQFYL